MNKKKAGRIVLDDIPFTMVCVFTNHLQIDVCEDTDLANREVIKAVDPRLN
ncbi:hypothetical protein QQ008_09440 [Fulvivirgaceae bacterium BMA10]|uniref:Uncharacterized protein n=1 Tax=Splendidivirga corallicola TaxID=3051826 RepID=A0ABT8KPX5_9BACT|nr:hypothetical protein [Fulvivirgaceae bacterium BMA10]